MKMLLFLLLSCLIPSFKTPITRPHALDKQRLIRKVIIKSVDFSTTTFRRIDCEAFEKQFPDANTTLVISKGTLDALNRRLVMLKAPDKNYNTDTRAKLTIYYNDSTTSTLCIGGAVMEFNGKKVKYDKELTQLLGILAYEK